MNRTAGDTISDKQYTPVIDFLIRLRKIDRKFLTVRDVLVLYTVMGNPGISGIDLARKLGIEHRSNITCNINRLVREGYIEDRRVKANRAIQTILHVLPQGVDFWNDLKP